MQPRNGDNLKKGDNIESKKSKNQVDSKTDDDPSNKECLKMKTHSKWRHIYCVFNTNFVVLDSMVLI